MYISEPGLYALVLRSKKPEAEAFQDWVVEDVLPQIRAQGSYRRPQTKLQLHLINETDLHYKVVDFIRAFHPDAILVAGLGENQDTETKRLDSWKKGYTRGQCDILLLNKHAKYTGLAIELKTPACTGHVSPDQHAFLKRLADTGYKTLMSNNYDVICNEIRDYFRNTRIMCHECGKWVAGRHSHSLPFVNGEASPPNTGETSAQQGQQGSLEA